MDHSLFVKTDHARRNTRQYSLCKATAFIQLDIGFLQFLALRGKLLRHPVKSTTEHGHFIIGATFINLGCQITRTHPLRRFNETFNGADKTRRDDEAEPYRRQHHHQ